MKEGQVLSRNMAIARQAEFSAEKQRLNLGFVTFLRRPFIEKVYNSVRKKGRP